MTPAITTKRWVIVRGVSPAYLAELIKKKKQSWHCPVHPDFIIIDYFLFPTKSWVYDTICGTHICNTKHGIGGVRKLKQVEANGSYDLVLTNDLVICLDNCHYAPSITRGVVSVSRLVDNGFVQCFTDYGISISKNNVFEFFENVSKVQRNHYGSAVNLEEIQEDKDTTPSENTSKHPQEWSRFQQNPGELHWTAVKNILKYLRNTKDMFLVYGGNPSTELRVDCYCNAGFEIDIYDMKSLTGYVLIESAVD
ncbi:hypothetical protein Tco_0476160 [Tanacetum coccineum]